MWVLDHEVGEKGELNADKMEMVNDATKRLRMARNRPRNVAKVHDNVEEVVNEALCELKMAFLCVYGGNMFVDLRHRRQDRT